MITNRPTGIEVDMSSGSIIQAFVEYYNKEIADKTYGPITERDVIVDWYSNKLRYIVAVVHTTQPDMLYYEITYRAVEKELWIDSYTKIKCTVCRVK